MHAIAASIPAPDGGGVGMKLRIGLHAGGVAAGVAGRRSLRYGVYGAARTRVTAMEQGAIHGGICASREFVELLPPTGASDWEGDSPIEYLATCLGSDPDQFDVK